MGAHAHGDEQVEMTFLSHLGKRRRVAQLTLGHSVRGVDLGWSETAHEQRLLAEHRLDRLTGHDRGDVELGRAVGEHVP